MQRSGHTDRDRFREVAAAAPAGARVPVERRVAVDDHFAAYRRARDGPGEFCFETTGGQPGWGYFGVDPAEREVVAGVRHRERPHVGVQFHPESVLTSRGKARGANFVEVCGTHG